MLKNFRTFQIPSQPTVTALSTPNGSPDPLNRMQSADRSSQTAEKRHATTARI